MRVFIPFDVFRLHLLPLPSLLVSVLGAAISILGLGITLMTMCQNELVAPIVKDQSDRKLPSLRHVTIPDLRQQFAHLPPPAGGRMGLFAQPPGFRFRKRVRIRDTGQYTLGRQYQIVISLDFSQLAGRQPKFLRGGLEDFFRTYDQQRGWSPEGWLSPKQIQQRGLP